MKSTIGKALRWIGNALGIGFVLMLALATIGAYAPSLPSIGTLGASALSWFGPWVAILALSAAFVGFRRWRAGGSRLALSVAIIAALTVTGSAAVVTTQWRAVAANGVSIDIARMLYPGPVRHRSGEPEVTSYARFEGEDLPIQIIRPPIGTPQRAPVLVYVHGGGFVGGVYWMRNHDLRWFADQGLVVVSVEYTLSNESRHLWDVSENQIGCGLAWVHANIAQYGGDPARVALIGESAGGNLVVNVANRITNGTLKPTCAGSVPAIAAVVANYPAVDLKTLYSPEPGAPAVSYLGGSPAQFPDRYEAIASATHLSNRSPPTLLIVGEVDQVVNPEPTYAFVRQAQSIGAPIELIRMPFGDHVFDFMAGSIPNQLFRKSAMRFLARYGDHLLLHSANGF